MPLDGGAAAVVQVVTELEQQARKDGDVTARRLTDWPNRLQVPAELHRFGETQKINVSELTYSVVHSASGV